MPENLEHAAENILNNIMETISDNVPKQKSDKFEEKSTVSSQMKKLFGCQNTIHKALGGGKSADVLLWRNKKISSSALIGATAVWVLFEWLNYHFLTLVAVTLVIGMIGQFMWSNASCFLSSSQSEVPRLVIPEELFVAAGLWAAAVIGSWCTFLTVLYIDTLPVFYEKYEDQVDDFLYKLFGQLQKQY